MRFTKDERKALETAAAGRPLAAYIRWLIFKEEMPAMPKKRTRGESASLDHKKLAKLLGALGKSRIANNINQLARTGQNPKAIKATLQECWAVSDDKKSFEHALQERVYYLAKGDRRGFVVIDIHGEVYSLTRMIGQKNDNAPQKSAKALKGFGTSLMGGIGNNAKPMKKKTINASSVISQSVNTS